MKKNFFWTVQFYKNGIPAYNEEFIKCCDRPPASIPYPPGTRFEMDFYFLWRPKNWPKTWKHDDCDAAKLKFCDAAGNVIEEWFLENIRFTILNESCDNDATEDIIPYDGQFTYDGNFFYELHSNFDELFKLERN